MSNSPKLIQTNEWSGRSQLIDMSDTLIATISRHNEYMSPEEVRKSLLEGKTVCTEMSRYKVLRECNRHSNCDVFDDNYKKIHGVDFVPLNLHCHDEDCEDCFGK